MTREELRDYVEEQRNLDVIPYHVYSTLIDGIDTLDQEPKTEWIPVSERLPEKDMLCLVAVGLLNLTQLAMYSDLMGVIDHRIFYQGDVGHDSFEDITEYVKAWIPLPEPYKAEKGGEE